MSNQEIANEFPVFTDTLPIVPTTEVFPVPEIPGKMSRFKTALGGLMLTSLAFTSIEATTAPEASAAPSCYGDYCSGQYAGNTGCDKDAKTITVANVTAVDYETSVGVPGGVTHVPFKDVKVGTIELRWSAVCKTAWARYNGIRDAGVSSVTATQDTGYKQSRNIGGLRIGSFREGSPANIAFTPMIYTPNNRVHASVNGKNLLEMSTDWTKQ